MFKTVFNTLFRRKIIIGMLCAESYPCKHSVKVISVKYFIPYPKTVGMDGDEIWNIIKRNRGMYSKEEIDHFSHYDDFNMS